MSKSPELVAATATGSASSSEKGGFLSRFHGHVKIQVEESTYAPPGTHWSNIDLDPVPIEKQTWRTYNFVTYWISDSFSISNWRISASLIAVGLSWQLALLAVALGNIIMASVVTFNGLIGARTHIPYSVQARSAFGFYFSYVMLVVRMIVSVFWYGIGTYNGASCVRTIIYAWAPEFRNMPNHLPASANIDSKLMICYFIYWLIILPFHYIPTHKIHWLFTIKAFLCPIAGFGIVGWIVSQTGGGEQIFQFEAEYSGAQLGWAFMGGMNAMIGNFATLGVNMNDFSRYSRNPRAPYIQLIAMPVCFIVIAIFGMIGANGSRILYGEIAWDPLTIADHWTSPGGRAAAFFVAFAFMLANIAINMSANSISVAVDLATLFPKYLNLRRAQYVLAVVGAWAITPWNILASAESLLTFMDGYSIFLGPIAGILISDYWFVNKQRLSIPDMYRPDGMYSYEKWGTNWRAVVAYFVGFVPLLPGLAQATSPTLQISEGASHLFAIGWLFSFLSSSFLYIVLSKVFPPKSEHTGKTIEAQLNEEETSV